MSHTNTTEPLTAFEAFKCIPVIDQVYGKVECIDFYENSLYIGTSDGNLLLYNFEEASTSASGDPVYRSNLNMRLSCGTTRCPVEQLVVIGPLSKLVVLCDGNVTVHNAHTLEQSTPTALLKGGNRICVGVEDTSYKLCVATRRKLHLFKYVGQFLPDKQLVIPDTAIALAWSGHHICVGYKREYLLLHDDTGETKDIFPLDRQTPLIKLLPTTNELLLRLEKIGVIMGFDIVASRPQVQWSYTPLAVGHSFPYVIALLKKTIEVHNLYDTSSCVQTVTLQGGKAIADDGHHVFVATSNRILALVPIPYEQQIKKLVQSRRVEDAIDLLHRQSDLRVEDLRTKISGIHIQAGFVYFNDLNFKQSMDHFNQCDIDPREILAWFPVLLPSSCHYRPQYQYPREDLESFVGLKLREREIIETTTLSEQCRLAKECVMCYLEGIREPADLESDPGSLQEAIDTVLLKLYVDLGASKLDEFCNLRNHASLSDCEPYLITHKRYNALALLFKQRGQDVKALDMWSKLGSEDVFDNGRDGVKETVSFLSGHDNHMLVMQYSRWVLQKDPEEGLKIFTSAQRQTEIPPDDVLDHLRSYKDLLSQQYLEYLVHVSKTEVGKYHTQLAIRYLEIMLSASSSTARLNNELLHTKQTLLKFLESSHYYDVSALLSRTAKTDMFEERVVLFKKADQHYQALRILVYNLDNTEAAESYCLENGSEDSVAENSTEPSGKHTQADLLLLLMKVYLSPPSGVAKMSMLGHALKLLEERGKALDPIAVLNELPPSIPIKCLKGFLDQAIPHHVHRLRDGHIVKNLTLMEHQQVSTKLIKEKSRRVAITDDRICPVSSCRRKIGSAAFGVLPNQKVVHFMCLGEQLHVCPVTEVNFMTNKKEVAQAKPVSEGADPVED